MQFRRELLSRGNDLSPDSVWPEIDITVVTRGPDSLRQTLQLERAFHGLVLNVYA
jgi:hypothetical protein